MKLKLSDEMLKTEEYVYLELETDDGLYKLKYVKNIANIALGDGLVIKEKLYRINGFGYRHDEEGRLIATLCSNHLFSTLSLLNTQRPFWKSHDISALVQEFVLDKK